MRPPGVLDLLPGIVVGLLPIALVTLGLVGAGLFAIRSRSGSRAEAARTTGLDLGLGLWLAITLLLTVVPVGEPRAAPPMGFIPFLDAIQRVADGMSSPLSEAADVVLNVILFMPLGVGIAVRWGRRWQPVAVVGAAALSIGIELGQALEGLGRFASATDVVTNTAGAALGFHVGLRIRGDASEPADELAHEPATAGDGPATADDKRGS